eukprot:symbB.v1.2.029613.t1/scaffold3177.1/size61949/1
MHPLVSLLPLRETVAIPKVGDERNAKRRSLKSLKVYVPDEVKALPAEAPILKSRRLRDPDGELLLPLKEAKPAKGGKAKSKRSRGTKSPAGFAASSKK